MQGKLGGKDLRRIVYKLYINFTLIIFTNRQWSILANLDNLKYKNTLDFLLYSL